MRLLFGIPSNGDVEAPSFVATDNYGLPRSLHFLFAEANSQIDLRTEEGTYEPPAGPWTEARLDAVHTALRGLYALADTDIVFVCASKFRQAGLIGLMFDHSGRIDSNGIPRQACAVFAKTPDIKSSKKAYLWTAAHELGHLFNLTHSSELMAPSLPNRVRFRFDAGDLAHLLRYPDDLCSTPGTSCPFRGPDTARTGRDGSGAWDLSLHVDREEEGYEVGQPVLATWTLTRKNSRGASVSYPAMHGDGILSYEVSRNNGPWRCLDPLSQPCMVHRKRHVRGRSRLFHSELLHLGSKGPFFSEPGEYRLRVTYSGLPGRREVSAETSFMVGSVGSGLGALLHSPLPARIVQWCGGRHLRSARKDLEAHSNDDSALAPYARFARAAAYEVSDPQDLVGLSKTAATDLRRNLEACLERGMPGALELRAVNNLACLEREGHSSKNAKQLVKDATRRWRSSPELGSLIRALSKNLAD